MSSGMTAGLALQAAQRLEMNLSPQLIQSMELLQLPLMQLEQRLRQEQLENPTLEIPELESAEGPEDAEGTASAPDGGADADAQPDAGELAGLERLDDIDYQWSDSHDDYSPARKGGQPDDEVFDPIANAQARPPSLSEHLERQLAETHLDGRARQLATALIGKLDANGWLTTPLDEAAPPDLEPPPGKRELEAALAELQKLDPDGIGARNLSECLLIQLRNRPNASPLALAMAKSHLEDLAANRLPKIARALKCDVEEVKAAAALIRTLNPRPGAGFAAEPALAVRPELKVEGDAESGFRARLVSGREPRIADFFIAMFDRSRRGRLIRERLETDPERGPAFEAFRGQMRRSGLVKSFRDKYNSAQWLVKAVSQREQTILTVADAVIQAQGDYLAGRTDAPATLFMQRIATELGFDISTVSRAVKDKYIDTPRGIKPLKFFFARAGAASTPAAADADGQAGRQSSAAAVMLRIKAMIEGEDKRRPLRDSEIMERLAADGVVIKRRSIVNYREKMGFPSHSHRRGH